jgi:Spy/CpxP family protein refolding chaperone
MMPSLYRRLAGVAFALLLTAGTIYGQAQAPGPRPPQGTSQPASTSNPRPGRPWWRSADWRKQVGVSSEAAARLDKILEDARPRLIEDIMQLDERESKLSRLIEENADEHAIAGQIDRVEAMRGILSKDRQLMLIHMRAVLTPEQQVKFNQEWVKWREAEQQPPQQRQSGSTSAPRPPASAGSPQRPAPSAPSSGAAPGRRPE